MNLHVHPRTLISSCFILLEFLYDAPLSLITIFFLLIIFILFFFFRSFFVFQIFISIFFSHTHTHTHTHEYQTRYVKKEKKKSHHTLTPIWSPTLTDGMYRSNNGVCYKRTEIPVEDTRLWHFWSANRSFFFSFRKPVFSPRFILRVSEISKFGITQIYPCRTMANAICISIYRLTCYRYFAHVLLAHAFRNLRYFIQPIATWSHNFVIISCASLHKIGTPHSP